MPQPIRTHEDRIKPEWIDSYGHMNVAHYITVCDQATWSFWEQVNDGCSMDQRDGHEYIVLETHVHYINEVLEGTPVYVTTQLLSHDDKRFIIFHHLWRRQDGVLSATNEVKVLAFNLNERRIVTFLPGVPARLAEIHADHQTLEAPEQAGHGIALKRR